MIPEAWLCYLYWGGAASSLFPGDGTAGMPEGSLRRVRALGSIKFKFYTRIPFKAVVLKLPKAVVL